MNIQILIGSGIIAAAILAVIGFYVWSCRIIRCIHDKKLTSLRQIQKELSNG